MRIMSLYSASVISLHEHNEAACLDKGGHRARDQTSQGIEKLYQLGCLAWHMHLVGHQHEGGGVRVRGGQD